MARMSDNDKSSSRYFDDSLQQTNWILDSGATCYITPQVQYFILGPFEEKDKHIEVTDGHYVMAKKKGEFQVKLCDDNKYPFITTFKNVLLAPDICNRLFSIIISMNLGHTCLFRKGFCTVYSGNREKICLLYHIVHSGNIYIGG